MKIEIDKKCNATRLLFYATFSYSNLPESIVK